MNLNILLVYSFNCPAVGIEFDWVTRKTFFCSITMERHKSLLALFLLTAPALALPTLLETGAKDSRTIDKRIQWFVSPGLSDSQIDFLMANVGIVDGIYTCCGGNTFHSNGSLTLPTFNKTKLQPFIERGIRVMSTFGGGLSSIEGLGQPRGACRADGILGA